MRNIRRSVALALAAIMMMAMNMVSFAALLKKWHALMKQWEKEGRH